MKTELLRQLTAEAVHPRGVAARIDSPDLFIVLAEREALLNACDLMLQRWWRNASDDDRAVAQAASAAIALATKGANPNDPLLANRAKMIALLKECRTALEFHAGEDAAIVHDITNLLGVES